MKRQMKIVGSPESRHNSDCRLQGHATPHRANHIRNTPVRRHCVVRNTQISCRALQTSFDNAWGSDKRHPLRLCTMTFCDTGSGQRPARSAYPFVESIRLNTAENEIMSTTTSPTTAAPVHKKLTLSFSGRIIDHLGIQMYQSPVAAIAELVANAWDADATTVEIELPTEIGKSAVIVMTDNGDGMTFQECEGRYLKVGNNRRDKPDARTTTGRAVLGRKGIGKFAGFGIAQTISIETISRATGEKTAFDLKLNELRADEYVTQGKQIEVTEYLGPDENRKQQHGTRIILRDLSLRQRPSVQVFKKSMSRRFTLYQNVSDFKIRVNGEELPKTELLGAIEFSFPNDYELEEKPTELLSIDNGWGIELLQGKYEIRWRIDFYKKPIDDEELRGIAIFSRGKLAQRPFFFNLSGGLGGQHGQEYLSGRVEADYVDALDIDMIATERQRINFEYLESGLLLVWGQKKVEELLKIWKKRRAKARLDLLSQKIQPFQKRLLRLPPSERKTVTTALTKIASIPSIEEDEFLELGDSLLLAWEGGRLREFINTLATTEEMSEKELLEILVEAKVLTSLHTAEAVKAKLLVIAGLHDRIKNHDLENAVRDYIADNPWLIDPIWETFKVEKSVNNVIKEAAAEANFEKYPDWDKRIDLVLGGGSQLLVVEFMRPGITVDWDHLSRFNLYVTSIRTQINANSASPYQEVSGLLVADKVNKHATVVHAIQDLKQNRMNVTDWEGLLNRALARWKDFLAILVARAPEDDRIAALAHDLSLA
ncbi:MAG: ATP-binding protein [Terriglobales bacterium]